MTCLLPSSPNWFCSGVSAVDGHDLLAFGSRYQVVLLDLSTRLCVGVRLPPPPPFPKKRGGFLADTQ